MVRRGEWWCLGEEGVLIRLRQVSFVGSPVCLHGLAPLNWEVAPPYNLASFQDRRLTALRTVLRCMTDIPHPRLCGFLVSIAIGGVGTEGLRWELPHLLNHREGQISMVSSSAVEELIYRQSRILQCLPVPSEKMGGWVCGEPAGKAEFFGGSVRRRRAALMIFRISPGNPRIPQHVPNPLL